MAKSERPKTEKPAKTARPRTVRRKANGSGDANPVTADARMTVPEFEIARRAFEIYCERGGAHGHDLDDWLRAEIELTIVNNAHAM
jgi:hypothetical protein